MTDKKKKILIVDDSALMRRLICDIIRMDDRFEAQDLAADGEEALAYIEKKHYDAVILDIEMPKKDGLAVLKEIKQRGLYVNVMVYSSVTHTGTDISIRALELGAIDCVSKPSSIFGSNNMEFRNQFLNTLFSVASACQKIEPAEKKQAATKAATKPGLPKTAETKAAEEKEAEAFYGALAKKKSHKKPQLVAIASSTGGPKALQTVISALPEDFPLPVLVVQHMPAGFTKSLAERLNDLCKMRVKEAENGESLTKGTVYIAPGGVHMEVFMCSSKPVIVLKDGPTREGVRPCANFMYESLAKTDYQTILCVVLTGMGADGTQGIVNLSKEKDVYVIAQDQATSVVYGMPRSIVGTGMVNEVEPIEQIAQAIIKNVEGK